MLEGMNMRLNASYALSTEIDIKPNDCSSKYKVRFRLHNNNFHPLDLGAQFPGQYSWNSLVPFLSPSPFYGQLPDHPEGFRQTCGFLIGRPVVGAMLHWKQSEN